MIKLNDKYFIDFDSYNILLKEKKVVQDGKNKGVERLENIGYYITFDELANSLLKRCYLKEDDNNIESLKDIQKLMLELRDDIVKNIRLLTNEEVIETNEDSEE